MERIAKCIGIVFLVLILVFLLYTYIGGKDAPAADVDNPEITEGTGQSGSDEAEPTPEPEFLPSEAEEQNAQVDKEPEGENPAAEAPVPTEEKPVGQPAPEVPETSSQPAEPETSSPPQEATEKPDAGASEESHSHSYEEVETPAICDQQGYTTYTCACGHSYQDRFQNPPGHDWCDWTTTKQPTYTQTGERIRTCRDCGAIKTTTLSKLEYEDPAACTHEWKKKYHAEVGHYGDHYNVCKCGWRFDDPKDWETHVMEAGASAVFDHTSWTSSRDYIVDVPAYYDWHCTQCGTVTDVEP